jgi:hypothetical protein
VRELRTPGFVRGALSNERPYRDRSLMGITTKTSQNLTANGAIAIKNVGHAQIARKWIRSPLDMGVPHAKVEIKVVLPVVLRRGLGTVRGQCLRQGAAYSE